MVLHWQDTEKEKSATVSFPVYNNKLLWTLEVLVVCSNAFIYLILVQILGTCSVHLTLQSLSLSTYYVKKAGI